MERIDMDGIRHEEEDVGLELDGNTGEGIGERRPRNKPKRRGFSSEHGLATWCTHGLQQL